MDSISTNKSEAITVYIYDPFYGVSEISSADDRDVFFESLNKKSPIHLETWVTGVNITPEQYEYYKARTDPQTGFLYIAAVRKEGKSEYYVVDKRTFYSCCNIDARMNDGAEILKNREPDFGMIQTQGKVEKQESSEPPKAKKYVGIAIGALALLAVGFFIGMRDDGNLTYLMAYRKGYDQGFSNAVLETKDNSENGVIRQANPPTTTNASENTPKPQRTPAPIPHINKPSFVTNDECLAPLEISVPEGNEYYYIVLASPSSKKRRASVFMRAGTTYEFNVPLGFYDLYYASGDTWYGYADKFGTSGSYAKADSILDFYIDGDYYTGHSIKLYPVYNGNLDSEKVDFNDFP